MQPQLRKPLLLLVDWKAATIALDFFALLLVFRWSHTPSVNPTS